MGAEGVCPHAPTTAHAATNAAQSSVPGTAERRRLVIGGSLETVPTGGLFRPVWLRGRAQITLSAGCHVAGPESPRRSRPQDAAATALVEQPATRPSPPRPPAPAGGGPESTRVAPSSQPRPLTGRSPGGASRSECDRPRGWAAAFSEPATRTAAITPTSRSVARPTGPRDRRRVIRSARARTAPAARRDA